MKPILFCAALAASLASAAEPTGSESTEKANVSVPEATPSNPASPAATPAQTAPEAPVVLAPYVVNAPRDRTIDLARTLDAQKQQRAAEKFSTVRGGTLYANDRVKVGGWWNPTSGWSFLSLKW